MSLIAYAEQHGITGDELAVLHRYGSLDFNQAWFYVSEEMVHDDLGQPLAKDMMRDFYVRHLTKHLMVDEHYCEIQRGDPVVTEYFRSANLPSGITAPKHVNGKKYYKISGEGLKHLAMMINNPVGKRTRTYFLKIEHLARAMIQDKEQLQLEEIDKLREQVVVAAQTQKVAELAIANAEKVETRMAFIRNEFFDQLVKTNPNETLYMMTNWTSLQKGGWKIGITTDKVGKRLASINTGHMLDDGHVVVKIWKCTSAKAAEDRIKSTLACLRDDNSREFFRGSYKLIETTINYIIDGLNEDRDFCSDQIRSFVDALGGLDCLPGLEYTEGLDPALLEKIKPRVQHLIKAPEELVVYQPKTHPEYTLENTPLIHAVKDYCEATERDWDWDSHAHNTHLRVRWKNLKPFVAVRAELGGLPRIKVSDRLQELMHMFREMLKHHPTIKVELRP